MNKGLVTKTLSLLSMALLLGCGGGDKPTSNTPAAAKTESAATPSNKVLAYVDNEAITEEALQFTMTQAMGKFAALAKDQSIRDKMLESMTLNRALAQRQWQAMSEAQQRHLDHRVKAFRDKLLVTQYLAKHMDDPKIIEQEMRAYYNSHLDEFGAQTAKKYELVQVPLASGDKAERIKNLRKVTKYKQWQDFVKQPYIQQFQVQHLSGTVVEENDQAATPYQEKLANVVRQLKKGAISPVQIFDNKAHIIRVVDSVKMNAKPYRLVKKELREKIKPRLIRNAIEQAAVSIEGKVNIVYVNDPAKNRSQKIALQNKNTHNTRLVKTKPPSVDKANEQQDKTVALNATTQGGD